MKFDPNLAFDLAASKGDGRPVARFRQGQPVGPSEDLTRIAALEARELNVRDPLAAELWTKHLRRERTTPCDCVARWGRCITDLRPVQGWALEEASDARGLLASIGVGDGKTGIDILLAMAIPGVRTAVLLIPPSLKPQFLMRDYPQWSAHFRTPNLAANLGREFFENRPTLHVVTYHELSALKNSDLLSRIPHVDLIIADEAHNLRDPSAARTIRFLRAFAKLPNTRFAALSGTLTTRSLKDYAHLAALAMRERSPLPIHPPTTDEWAAALDAVSSTQPFLKHPGSLLEAFSVFATDEIRKHADDTERARLLFQRRFTSVHGVIVTQDSPLKCSLVLSERRVMIPAAVDAESVPKLAPEFVTWLENGSRANLISKCVNFVRELKQRPDGEELIEVLEIARCVRQVASGFFYRWRYPRGETVDQIKTWLKLRKAWRAEIRAELQYPRENYDSPGNVTRAAIRWFEGYHADVNGERKFFPPGTRNGPLPVFAAQHWLAWKAVHKTVQPETEAVWISDWLVRDSIEWAKTQPGIVWFEHDEFMTRARQIAREQKLNFGFFPGGKEASATIILEKGDRSIFASIKAHGEGKNLQYAFSRNLIVHPPSNGKTTEQLLGRTHREGQPADEVSAEFYRYHAELVSDIAQAEAQARYAETTTSTPQRLNFASKTWDLDD